MKIDFWRAIGTGALCNVAWMSFAIFAYSALEYAAADYVMTAVFAVLLVLFSYAYFQGGAVEPNVGTGFWLAVVWAGFAVGAAFISGMAAAAQQYPMPVLPEPAPYVYLLAFVSAFAAPTLVGWYLSKHN